MADCEGVDVGKSTADQRFWAKVNKTETCWLWTAGVSSKGYGRFAARTGEVWYAHRWAYSRHVGPIPEGMQIDHKCHVRRCVNPSHLQAVTQSLNMQNRRGANRQSVTGIRGVTLEPRVRNKYQVQVWSNGKMHREYHATLEEAEIAAIALRNRLMTNNLADRHGAAG